MHAELVPTLSRYILYSGYSQTWVSMRRYHKKRIRDQARNHHHNAIYR